MARTKVKREGKTPSPGFVSFVDPDTEKETLIYVGNQPPKFVDGRTPMTDDDGSIPEFVNTSGKKFQRSVANQPNDTVKIPPFGILTGAQWRDMAEPAKAWGNNPHFMERERNKDGKYDPVYLLSERQLLGYTKKTGEGDLQIPGLVQKIINPHHGPKKLKDMLDHGKIQTYDKAEHPVKRPEELMEDRQTVSVAINKKIRELETEKKVRDDIMTGKRAARPALPKL